MSDEPEGESTSTSTSTSTSALADIGDNNAVFEGLWEGTIAGWDEDAPHRAILEHALRCEMLPDLAGRYRSLKDDPVRGARAQKKIDGIVIAATQIMMATKTPVRTKTPWQWSALAALMFGLVCAWLCRQLFFPHH